MYQVVCLQFNNVLYFTLTEEKVNIEYSAQKLTRRPSFINSAGRKCQLPTYLKHYPEFQKNYIWDIHFQTDNRDEACEYFNGSIDYFKRMGYQVLNENMKRIG